MNLTVDLSEMGKLQTLLGAASNHATTGMRPILDDVAEAVAEGARRNAPILSGDLQNSIGVLRRAGNAQASTRWVGTELRQGFFQEFGTSEHPPQPWLNPAADAGVRTLGEAMEKLGEIW